MRVLYFDCFAGASGDMIVGALVDAGLPFDALTAALGSLAIDGWEVSADRVLKTGVTATKFRVRDLSHGLGATPDRSAPPHSHDDGGEHAQGQAHGHDHDHDHRHDHSHGHVLGQAPASGLAAPHQHPHAHAHPHAHHNHHSLSDIEAAIGRSALGEKGQARAIRMFRRLAHAEAAIHGMPVEQVHLHEVGAVDSIIDIVAAVFGLDWFAADRIVVSPLNVGGGMVRSAHGVFPVPAPATLRLLGDAPVYSSGAQSELLTPTGALILSEYATSFGPMPAMTVRQVGYGAGDRDLPETPNVVRLVVGEAADLPAGMRVVTIECEIDDMNPQIFGALMDRLYAAGALEVFYASVQMKKNRPGTLMTIVARPEQRDTLTALVFRETTTIGVRYHEMARECLARETVTIATVHGPVRFKVARRDGRVLNAQPEFDDLARAAAERGVPIKEVQAQATKAWIDSGLN